MPKAKRKLFISHISTEAELAKGLKAQLERDFPGLDRPIFVSSDLETIKAGDKWLARVEKALKEADLQLVLCSEESVGRPWVNFEAGAVWLRGIPVIPVCHSGMKRDQLPVPLSTLQAIEVSQPDGLRKLYSAIAAKLDVKAPVVDFDALARGLNKIEQKYIAARHAVDVIENPRILCAASSQYAQPSLGFHLDAAVLKKAFPRRVAVRDDLTGARLRELLIGERFDIVHLVLAVEPDTGDLIFSPIDFNTYKPSTPKPDRMSPTSFAELLRESHTRLVVLATCKALLLAVEVAHVANMAASDAVISGEEAEEWGQFFYGLLAQGRSLHKAFEIAKSQIEMPIRPIRHKDVCFARPAQKS